MQEIVWLNYRDEAARRVRRDVRTVQRWRAAGVPMWLRDGERVVDEEVLLAWWRDRLDNWPAHQYRMRRSTANEM